MVLRVLVIGGGLAGVASALVLRRAGHQVSVSNKGFDGNMIDNANQFTYQLFEASQLSKEDTVGPNVHLGPKSVDILRGWDIDLETARGVLIREVHHASLWRNLWVLTVFQEPEFNLDGNVQSENAPPVRASAESFIASD